MLTKEQRLVITGYTGVLCCNFSEFHADVEQRLGRAVLSHEFGNRDTNLEIKAAYKADFLLLVTE